MMEFHREHKDSFTRESAPVNLIIGQQKSQSLSKCGVQRARGANSNNVRLILGGEAA